MTTVRNIKEFAGRRDLNLRAGVPLGDTLGKGRYRLKGRQGSGRRVHMIRGDTAALLIRKIDYVPGGMKAVVTGTEVPILFNLERRVWSQMAGVFIEPELVNHIWP